MKKITLSFLAIALSSMAFAQSPRMQLFEEFTGENCGPCAASNPTLNTLLATNTSSMISLKYDSPIPSSAGPNSIYGKNMTDVDNRITYYSVPFAPYGRQDGYQIPDPNNQSNGHVAFLTQSVITARTTATSPFTLAISHSFKPAFDSAIVTVVITASQAYSSNNLKFRLAMAEKTINLVAPTGSNGEKDFYNTMRKMIPDYNGTALTGSWTNGQTQTLTFRTAIPNYIYDFSQIEFVGFIQDDATLSTSTYNIQQAGMSSPIALPSTLVDGGITNNTVAPTNLCATSVVPTFTFKNNGATAITSATIAYSINGGAPVTQNWTGNLASNATTTITFPAATLSPGSVTIVGSIVSVNGGATSNYATTGDYNGTNNISDAVTFSVVPVSTVGSSLSEGFESVTLYTIGAPIPNAVQVNPNTDPMYVVDKNVTTGVTQNLGGFGNSTKAMRWKFPYFNSGDAAAVVFEKINLSGKSSVGMTFSYAYARFDANSSDALNIKVSTDCGNSWTTVWSKAGSTLMTGADNNSTFFYPAVTDWAGAFVNLTAYNNAPEIMVMFEGVQGAGNNLYVDDINLNANVTTGVADVTEKVSFFNIFPNPASNNATLNFQLKNESENTSIVISDIAGKVISSQNIGKIGVSNQSINLNTESLNSGLYFVKLISNNTELSVQKLSVVK